MKFPIKRILYELRELFTHDMIHSRWGDRVMHQIFREAEFSPDAEKPAAHEQK